MGRKVSVLVVVCRPTGVEKRLLLTIRCSAEISCCLECVELNGDVRDLVSTRETFDGCPSGSLW